MNAITPTAQAKPIVVFREQLEQRANELKMALPAHITPEKFQRTVLTAVQRDPDLLLADRQSLILSCMQAAQDGLLPDKREAAIVIFNENKKTDNGWVQRKIATYMPMVYGLRKKILQSGEVSTIEVGIVYDAEVESGDFYYRVGVEPPLGHRPTMKLTAEQTTDDQIVAAYSIATMKDGTRSYEVMRRFEIDKVRECSQTGATRNRKGEPRKPSGPWVEWFPEQAKKTVMRRHSKVLPMSGDLILDVEGRELEAGASAAAMLGSRPGGTPQAIEDQRDLPAHDADTGELIDDATGGPDTDTDFVQADDVQADQGEPDAQVNDQAELTETGTTRTPGEIKADEIIGEVKAAISVMDVNSIESRCRPDIEAMDADVAAAVRATIGARKAEIKAAHDKAKAQEVAE